MRILPSGWSYETVTCGLTGHVVPAATVRELRPRDRRVGFDVDGHGRFARCVRCDVWVHVVDPQVTADELPPLDELDVPPRGRALRDLFVLRIIAVIRGLHSVAFTVLAVGLAMLMTHLDTVEELGRNLRTTMETAVDHSGQQASRSFVNETLVAIDGLQPHELKILFATAVAYALLEGVEAVGLWHRKRWAEYLTVVATAGFLPFEIGALTDKVTVPRIGALAVNIAILGWLVWSKRLFGLRGGTAALEERNRADTSGWLDATQSA